MSWKEIDTKNFEETLDKFKEQMIKKFVKKFDEGYRGWNSLTEIPQLWNFHLKEKLLKTLSKKIGLM